MICCQLDLPKKRRTNGVLSSLVHLKMSTYAIILRSLESEELDFIVFL